MVRYDPTLRDLTSKFFVLCTDVKVYYIIIHSGWSLARIFMKESNAHADVSIGARGLIIGLAEPSSTFIFCACKEGRLWHDCAYAQAHLSFAAR